MPMTNAKDGGGGIIGQADARGHYSVDNKSCQGAKAITTWPRALSGKSRAFSARRCRVLEK